MAIKIDTTPQKMPADIQQEYQEWCHFSNRDSTFRPSTKGRKTVMYWPTKTVYEVPEEMQQASVREMQYAADIPLYEDPREQLRDAMAYN
jgi:hypothetical protein